MVFLWRPIKITKLDSKDSKSLTVRIVLEVRGVFLFCLCNQGLIWFWEGPTYPLSEAEAYFLFQSANYEGFLGVG